MSLHSQGRIICALNNVTKRVSPNRVLFCNGVDLTIHAGSKIGVIGPNGIGKSSLLRIIAGLDREFEGKCTPSNDVTIEYLPQEPYLDPSLNVLENIHQKLHHRLKVVKEYEEISRQFEVPSADIDQLMVQLSRLQSIIEEHDLWDFPRHITMAMSALNCAPATKSIVTLSGGEIRRIALAASLLQRAQLLLLDEPTNHLDAQSVSWLEQYLLTYRGSVLAITHDRYFLDNVATHILEVDQSSVYLHEGNYSHFLDRQVNRKIITQKTSANQREQMNSELKWMRAGGRHQASKSRLKNYQKLVDQSRKEDSLKASFCKGKLIIPYGKRLGNRVMQVSNLRKIFNDRVLFDNVSFTIEAGAIVGVIGSNGVGKSTLMDILVGQQKADWGDVKIGETVQIAHITQSRQQLDEEQTVFREIVPDLQPVQVGPLTMQARQYVAQFNFQGAQQEKLIKHLSGGERNRVHLAKLLKGGCNCLFLDEPTNDLDVETLRALEEGLHGFPGSAFVISHDRWFLDRTCTHILAFEGDGIVQYFPGNYTEYAAHLQTRLSKSSIDNPSEHAKFPTIG